MQKIYNPATIQKHAEKSRYQSIINALDVEKFLAIYEKGEMVTSPFREEILFQIVLSGSLSIYFIRNDGARYSLSSGGVDYILGDMELFYPQTDTVYTEAAEQLVCFSVSIEKNREALLKSNTLLQLVGKSLVEKISAIAMINAAPASLTERVLSYMRYRCKNRELKGVERSAFQLHCSARQLQRVLNCCVQDGSIEKIGKGAYRLLLP